MSVFTQLYRGETRFDFIGSRKRWYLASLVMIVLCILSISFRGFNVGIDFKGGTQFQIKAAGTSLTPKQVEEAMTAAGHSAESAAQEVGSGSTRQIIIKTRELKLDEQFDVQKKLAAALKVDPNKGVSVDSVSSSWGSEITRKAIQGLVVFLIVVFAYITLRFEWKMAVGALGALLHDLIIAAGVYSIVGFELTPSTIVGLLTILGFSLYDTVVVFDKVAENTKDLLATGRETYASAANRAVNQTLMRSINTSLISLLPVAGLLFVGAGLLGVGTIKDLALILFVGLAVGAYSSLFLAAPVVVDLKEREPQYRALTRRVEARRSAGRVADEAALAGATAPVRRGTPAPAPRPGVRPARKRP
ncbi:protein translocase subunit SecF [Jatrophihabitans sp.]|uniref:protein translocase subunit SecF n=1 Tax=Jatrophihabitans sp. TaxID=1932789 RepID=UPI002CCA55ED|nr:protein translocase subunit SecF [Jatrophihabitans sp.]